MKPDGKGKLTEAQRRELQHAANNQFGLNRQPPQGLPWSTWAKVCNRLVDSGFMAKGYYCGYEITDAGRRALTGATTADP